jgi:uracil-DNA glycosylase
MLQDVACTFLPQGWHKELKDELSQPYFLQLVSFLQKERALYTIYPPKGLVFNAFYKTDFDQVRVVILGQDPYHGPNQAHGLAFSVPQGITFPPSLRNIFKELRDDLGIEIPTHGCLESWAQQGVLLLNTLLTVREGQPGSHANKGWEQFTDRCLSLLWQQERPVIFVLWGSMAQNKVARIFQPKRVMHTILSAPHPSPLSASRGFFGSAPFSKINKELTKRGNPIDWRIT